MENRTVIGPALRAALLFCILSMLWITLSDQGLVLMAGDDPMALARWSTVKGIAYTLVVALAIFALVRRDFRVIHGAYQEVEAGQTHLRLLLNSMPQAVIVADREGRLRFVNDGAVALYGHTEEALLKMTAAQLTTAKSPGKLSQFLQAAQRGQPFDALTIDVRKSGETFDANIHAVPIRWHEQPCMLVSITEVSRQRRLERELRESAHQYTQLTQNSRDLIIRCTKDAYVLAANIATLDMLGCSSSAVLCRPLSELELDSTSIRQLEAAIQQTFATSSSVACSTTLTARRGQRQVDWQVVPEFGQQDHVRGVLLVGRDLTERIDMQAKLGTSEASLQAILDRIRGGRWTYYPTEKRLVLDEHLRRFLEWQGGRTLTGDSPITEQHHPADVAAITAALNAVISGESDTLDSIHRLRREHSADWVWVHAWGHCSKRDARGQAVEIVGITFDITRQRTAEMGNALIEPPGNHPAIQPSI
jgi:PAS domain S-box-containing protein